MAFKMPVFGTARGSAPDRIDEVGHRNVVCDGRDG
jgi:hypothetical protein